MARRNNDIRQAIKDAEICTWEVAERMGVHENTLYRTLRTELPLDQKRKVLKIINELKSEVKELQESV